MKPTAASQVVSLLLKPACSIQSLDNTALLPSKPWKLRRARATTTALFVAALAVHAAGGPIRPLAQDHVVVVESPDPERIYCFTPGIARLRSGRLIATMDFGGPGMKDGQPRGRIFTSDDGGLTWSPRGSFPFHHARPFEAGGSLYILGHSGDLMIIRSDDGGLTWSAPARLTDGQSWHGTAGNVLEHRGHVYLVMERRTSQKIRVWPVGELAPVLLRGRADADLTNRAHWQFASELSFADTIPNLALDPALDYFGVPFFAAPYPFGSLPAARRTCAPIGWLEGNVVRFADPDHLLHDPSDRTFYIWLRAHTGGAGYAAVAKVVERGDGSMTTQLATVPSGKRLLYVPCPGGHLRFHVLYDEPSKLFWLLSSQSTDSMTRPDRLPPDRYGLPNNERHRLQLHFSRNMFDWCFAGLVATGATPREARSYAAMAVDGDDLVILSRSGDARAKSAHDTNLITFHRIRRFRELVY